MFWVEYSRHRLGSGAEAMGSFRAVVGMNSAEFNAWWEEETFKTWWNRYEKMVESDAWPMSANFGNTASRQNPNRILSRVRIPRLTGRSCVHARAETFLHVGHWTLDTGHKAKYLSSCWLSNSSAGSRFLSLAAEMKDKSDKVVLCQTCVFHLRCKDFECNYLRTILPTNLWPTALPRSLPWICHTVFGLL